MKKFKTVACVTVTIIEAKHKKPWYKISLSQNIKNGNLPLAALCRDTVLPAELFSILFNR